jgi:hypothetical protein
MKTKATLGVGLLLSSLWLLACSNPPVQTSADRQGLPITTTLSGQVVFQGTARGDAFVFLFDANNPPPPVGTGHPLTFQRITADQLFGSSIHDGISAGPFAASYQIPLVAPGTYLVTATLDGDVCLTSPGNSCRLGDFNPFFDVTDQPDGVDFVGGHVDAQGSLVPVVVPPPDSNNKLAAVGPVQVVIGQAMPDRPVFNAQVASSQVPKNEPTLFTLAGEVIELGPVDEQQPVFLVRYRDDNHDGVPDVDANGIPQLWPRVVVRKIADPDPSHPSSIDPLLAAGLRDENDLDNNGQLDATGISYAHLAPNGTVIPAGTTPDLVVLAAAIALDPIPNPPPTNPAQLAVPLQIYAQLAEPDGGPDMNKVLQMTTLPMVILPEALDAADPTQPQPLTAMPPGRYAVIVEQYTGQTWRLPNELQPAVATSRLDVGGVTDQGFFFTVSP